MEMLLRLHAARAISIGHVESRLDELLCVFRLRTAENIFDRTLFDDLAVLHDDDIGKAPARLSSHAK